MSQLHLAIHTTTRLVAIGLKMAEQIDGSEVELPAFFRHKFSGFPVQSIDETRNSFNVWSLRNGFRDCVESLGKFLEETRLVCAVISFGPSRIEREQFNRIDKEGRKFHRGGLPDKLAELQKQFSLPIDSDTLLFLESINAARNCLVHRQGIVGHPDVSLTGTLEVGWKKFALFAEGDSGKRTLKPNSVVEAGESLIISIVNDSKSFQLGDTLLFTVQEFSEIASFLSNFAQLTQQETIKMARNSGFTISSPQSTK